MGGIICLLFITKGAVLEEIELKEMAKQNNSSVLVSDNRKHKAVLKLYKPR